MCVPPHDESYCIRKVLPTHTSFLRVFILSLCCRGYFVEALCLMGSCCIRSLLRERLLGLIIEEEVSSAEPEGNRRTIGNSACRGRHPPPAHLSHLFPHAPVYLLIFHLCFSSYLSPRFFLLHLFTKFIYAIWSCISHSLFSSCFSPHSPHPFACPFLAHCISFLYKLSVG